MLMLLAMMKFPDPCITWFHDQVSSFIHDHYYEVDAHGHHSKKQAPLPTAYGVLSWPCKQQPPNLLAFKYQGGSEQINIITVTQGGSVPSIQVK